jgi:hypothetical protein
MAVYRTIDASFWTDPKMKRANPESRLLFLYLITNPHTHVSGLYYLPWLIAEHETGLSKKQLDSAADTLSNLGVCRFDRANELVWVVKMFAYQGRGLKNTLSAAHHLNKDLHNSFLINEFVIQYPDVGKHVENRVSIGYSADAPPENGEQRTENREEPPIVPRKAVDEYSVEFETFWSAYPKHAGKGAAWKLWKKIRPSLEVQRRIFDAIAEQRKSQAWIKENGQYIPHPATWLNQRRWDDDTSVRIAPRTLQVVL